MVKRQSEYTPAQWAALYPEERHAAAQAEADAKLRRDAIPIRAPDGRGVVYIDPVSRQPVPNPASQARVMG